jgi:hypothetical protein
MCPPQDWTVLNRAQGLWHVAMRTQWWPHIQPRLELTSISIAWFCTHPLLCAPPPTANLVVTLTSKVHECQALQKTLLGSYFFLTSILPRAGGHPFYR